MMLATRLSQQVWAQVSELIARSSGNEEITRGTVIKVDAVNRNVFVKEFGETAIPLVGFDIQVDFYDTTTTGVEKKTSIARAAMPKVGDLVVIARQGGARRLPLCLGIVQGKNYMVR